MEVIVEKANGNSIETVKKKIKDIAEKVELIIVLGEKKNANIEEMYHISLKECGNAMLVETMDDLYLNYIKRFRTVGVIQNNFLPQEKEQEIVDILEDTQVEGYIYGHFK